MKVRIYNYLFLLIIGLSSSTSLWAQNQDEVEEIASIVDKLPPLQALIDSAILNSPAIKFQDAEILKNQLNIRITKNNWTKNLGINGDFLYGTYDNLSLDPATGTSTINTKVESRYATGIFIRLPLYDAINTKNEVGIASYELEQAKQLKESRIQAVRQLVINQYYDVVYNERLLNILSRNQQSADLQLQMAEKQFTNGQISIEDLARITEINNDALVSFEKAKIELNTSYLILQEIVGFTFNLN
jgi:outer membrane protein TolC